MSVSELRVSDVTDAFPFFTSRSNNGPERFNGERPVVNEAVERDSPNYNMNHKRRGRCLIIYYREFSPSLRLSVRECAERDKGKIKNAFEKLGFQTEEYFNLRKKKLISRITEVSKEDHSDNDCLAMVFMSHGAFDRERNEQWLWTYDDKIFPQDLWSRFLGVNCPSLVGKPKLFFFQACRGEETDTGLEVRKVMKVEVDALGDAQRPQNESYTLPSQADMLIMWASYPGHFAFKTNNHGILGSVFVHFLAEVLEEDGEKENIASMLLTVSRRVAIEYESVFPMGCELNANKQIPTTESTLLRHVYFKPKDASRNKNEHYNT